MQQIICHIKFGNLLKLSPLLHELQAMDRFDFEIHIILPGYNNDADYLREKFPMMHFHFLRIRSREILRSRHPVIKAIRYFEFILRTALRAMKVEAKLYVAHDLTVMIPATVARFFRRTALVYRAHEIYSEAGKKTSPLLGLWNKVERFFVRRTKHIIVPEINRAHIYKNEYGASQLPTVVRNIPPVNKRYTESQELRKRLSLSDESIIVLYQGLISPSRCIEELIQSFTHLSEKYHCVIIGDVPPEYKQTLHSFIEQLLLTERIHFLPFVPSDELPSLTASSDIGCLLYRNESRNNYYAAPNKLYEYLFSGLPVVVSNFPALMDPVRQYNIGSWTDPENPAEIARAIETAASREKGSQLSQRMQEVFQWEKELDTLIDVYKTALQTR